MAPNIGTKKTDRWDRQTHLLIIFSNFVIDYLLKYCSKHPQKDVDYKYVLGLAIRSRDLESIGNIWKVFGQTEGSFASEGQVDILNFFCIFPWNSLTQIVFLKPPLWYRDLIHMFIVQTKTMLGQTDVWNDTMEWWGWNFLKKNLLIYLKFIKTALKPPPRHENSISMLAVWIGEKLRK